MKVLIIIFLWGVGFAYAGVFGKRYCEIVYSKNLMDFYVYRSSQESSCPQSWWRQLNKPIIQKKYRTKFVHLNGPRLWVVDDVKYHSENHSTEIIEGQKLHLVGSFHPNMKMLFERNGPYVEYKIHRSQSYMLNKGRKVVELISPQGKIYVLQSLSLKFKKQSVNDLDKLKMSLRLPAGWKLKQGELGNAQNLEARSQICYVVQDEFENTYLLSNRDLL